MSQFHDAAVQKISGKVKEFYDSGKPFRIYHGSTNTTRRYQRPPNASVDLSGLKAVLSVCTDTNTALVEPNVPMDSLVAETLKYGLVPPVVMEFAGITAGGAFAGTGGESSSFRWGTFDRIVNRIEIVLPNGDIVWASDKERGDLFNGSAGALGTLGVLTLLEVQLIPAKSKLVELRYHPFHSTTEAVTKMREYCQEDAGEDYVDGIMYSKMSGAVITGKLLDGDRAVTARYSRAADDWYYSDVQSKLQAHPDGWTDVVPLEDYLFRYDRGAFWCARHTFQELRLPFNSWTRWLFDSQLRTRALFRGLHASGSVYRSIIQDLCIPAKNLDAIVDYIHDAFPIWPLWFCPMRPNAGRGLFQLSATKYAGDEKDTGDLWINVGVWGVGLYGYGLSRFDEAVEANRNLENKVHALGGYKWLYSQTFYTEEEFWRVYPSGEYETLRKKYHATSLPTVYDKVRTDVEKERQALAGWKSGRLYEAIAGLFGPTSD